MLFSHSRLPNWPWPRVNKQIRQSQWNFENGFTHPLWAELKQLTLMSFTSINEEKKYNIHIYITHWGDCAAMCVLRGNLAFKEARYGSVFSPRPPKLFIILGREACTYVTLVYNFPYMLIYLTLAAWRLMSYANNPEDTLNPPAQARCQRWGEMNI